MTTKEKTKDEVKTKRRERNVNQPRNKQPKNVAMLDVRVVATSLPKAPVGTNLIYYAIFPFRTATLKDRPSEHHPRIITTVLLHPPSGVPQRGAATGWEKRKRS